MSKAYKCDRCGVYMDFPISKYPFYTLAKVENYEIMGSLGNKKFETITTEIDLCIKCSNELKEWFTNV